MPIDWINFSYYLKFDLNIFSFTLLQAKVKAKDLRGKKKEDLLKQLDELKNVMSLVFSFLFTWCPAVIDS